MKTNPARILIIDGTTSFGGAFEHLVNLLNSSLLTSSYNFGVATAQPISSRLNSTKASYVKTFEVSPPPKLHKNSGKNLLSKLYFLFKEILLEEYPAARKLILDTKSFNAQIIHLNNLLNGQRSAALAAIFSHVPLICTHADFEDNSVSARVLSKFIKHNIAVSGAVKNSLLNLGIQDKLITVIPPAVNLDEFAYKDQIEMKEFFPNNSINKVFALFGRVTPWKGQREFIQASMIVLKKMNNVGALIVGAPDDDNHSYFDELREIVINSGLNDRIIFTGFRRDISSLMSKVDLVVHLSQRPEPFGMVLLEAMAANKAVIASNDGGPLDIVLDGETGFLVNSHDPEQVASKIMTILQNEFLLEEFGTKGRTRAYAEFSLDSCVNKHLEVYKNVLANFS